MRNRLNLNLVLLKSMLLVCLPISLCAQNGSARLEGCPDPSKLAGGLRALQALPWREISLERVQQVWPTYLHGETCDPHCTRLASDGRVIKNELECGESLHFDTNQEPEGSLKATLESIAIKYTTQTTKERDTVEAILANGLIRGRKVEEGSGVLTGVGWTRDLSWTDQQPEVRSCELSIAHTHLEAKGERFGMRWLVIFSLECRPGT